MTNDSQTFTLDEARRAIALDECRRYGHDWSTDCVRLITGETIRLNVRCPRCGWGGKVEMVGPDPSRTH